MAAIVILTTVGCGDDSGTGGTSTTVTSAASGTAASGPAATSGATATGSTVATGAASSTSSGSAQLGPQRIVFVYATHGSVPSAWRPSAEGADFTLPQILEPLEPFHDRLTILEGLDLDLENAPVIISERASLVLTASVGSIYEPISNESANWFLGGGPSLDVVLGQRMPTAIPNVALSAYSPPSNRFLPSWTAKDEPFLAVNDMRVAFESIFAGAVGPEVDAMDALVTAAGADPEQRPHVALSLIGNAFALDITRVGTMSFCAALCNQELPWIQPGSWNDLAHAGDLDAFATLQTWVAGEIARFAADLDAIPEGNGTLLDRTTIVWLTEVGFGAQGNRGANSHENHGVPVVILGGGTGLKAPYYHRYQGRPYADLLVTLGQQMGLDIDTFGTGAQSGPLSEIVE